MLLQCPNCRRTGNVRDDLSLTAHKMRCRRCNARFSTAPGHLTKGSRTASAVLRSAASAQPAHAGGALASVSTERFFSGYDDDPSGIQLGPGDSHYEVSVGFDDMLVDSNFELPAFTQGAAVPDDGLASSAFEPSSSEIFLPSPWYYNFIDSWNRFHFFVVLGFGTSALAILGFFLVKSLVGGQSVDSSITTLIVGCVLTVATVLLSVSATALIVLLVDLGKHIRRLSVQSNPDARIAGE